MSNESRPPRRRPRRGYPLHAYIPFAIMAAIPTLLIIAIITLIIHLAAPPSHPVAAPRPTPRPSATAIPRITATQSVALAALAPTVAVRTPTPPAPRTALASTPTAAVVHAVAATAPVTIALGADAAGLPVGAGTVLHGAHARLWAFASVQNVHAGDTIHFIWRDLARHVVVADWPDPVQVDATRYDARMYAFWGSAPNSARPFPPGRYRVDVYRNATLVASSDFTVEST